MLSNPFPAHNDDSMIFQISLTLEVAEDERTVASEHFSLKSY